MDHPCLLQPDVSSYPPRPAMQKVIAERLRVLRGERDQAVVAEGAGIPLSTYSKWEKDTMQSAEGVAKLAKFYGVSADYLLGLSDHPSGFSPNSWLIDDDAVDEILEAKFVSDDDDEPWAVAIPARPRVVSSAEYRRLRKKLQEALRKER